MTAQKITPQYPEEDFLSEHFYCAEPSFNQEEFNLYLQKTLVLDSLSLDTIPAGEYKLVAVFEIDQDLIIKNVRVVNDPGYGLGKRVKESIQNFRSSNRLDKQRQTYLTKSFRKQPITFIVEEEE